MAQSVERMLREGTISARHAPKIGRAGTWTHGPAGTRGEKSKMASFDDKSKTDAGLPQRGPPPMDARHINGPDQDFGPRVSRGGRVNRGGQPGADHIDKEQGPLFPAGDKVKRGKRGIGKNQRSRANPPDEGMENYYGGPNGRP